MMKSLRSIVIVKFAVTMILVLDQPAEVRSQDGSLRQTEPCQVRQPAENWRRSSSCKNTKATRQETVIDDGAECVIWMPTRHHQPPFPLGKQKYEGVMTSQRLLIYFPRTPRNQLGLGHSAELACTFPWKGENLYLRRTGNMLFLKTERHGRPFVHWVDATSTSGSLNDAIWLGKTVDGNTLSSVTVSYPVLPSQIRQLAELRIRELVIEISWKEEPVPIGVDVAMLSAIPLESLIITSPNVGIRELRGLEKLKSLESISFSTSSKTPFRLSSLAKCSKLKYLMLNASYMEFDISPSRFEKLDFCRVRAYKVSGAKKFLGGVRASHVHLQVGTGLAELAKGGVRNSFIKHLSLSRNSDLKSVRFANDLENLETLNVTDCNLVTSGRYIRHKEKGIRKENDGS